jgi:hypothetical protein
VWPQLAAPRQQLLELQQILVAVLVVVVVPVPVAYWR